MLQRQIMFKQLQELQRRQQLQELGGARNQDYVDQLTSSKQPSAVQLAPTVNRAPIRDSRMLMFDNMQMIQQGESSIFQGFPSGLVLSQGHSNALGPMGMMPPQFDMSLYGNPAPNADKDLNLYPYPQDPSNFSANLPAKNNNSPLGMSHVHSSATASSFMSQQGHFSADQSIVSDGSLLPSHVFQEKNMFGQVPFHSSNSNLLSVNYSPQGITTQRSIYEGRLEDTGWPGNSPGEVSKVDMSEAAASLDPLEQKILYSSDDHGWLSSFGSSKMGAGDFECTVENPSFVDTLPSLQSGSWSALMQSAVTETSSSDTAVQEEWSGLSFQNPEPSSDNQLSNFSNGEKLQDNWVDRNLQNVSSPSSEPEQLFPRSNMNCSFPGFQHSGKQYLKQKDEFQCESSLISGPGSPRNISQLTDYNSQLKHPTGRDQVAQTSLLPENAWTAQYKANLKNGHELKDTLWRSNPLSGGFQMPFDQLNQPNFHRYSVESEKMGPGDNADPLSSHLGASDPYGQNVAAQSILPNSQGFGFGLGPADSRTPESYSGFPSLPMGYSNAKSLPNSYEKDYVKNQHPTPQVPNHMTTKLPAYTDPSSPQINFQGRISSCGPGFSLLENVAVTQPSGTSVSSQRVGFPTGLSPLGPDITTQQDVSSPRANKFSSSLFRTPGSASSSLEANSQAPEQAHQSFLKHEHNVAAKNKAKSSMEGMQLGEFSPSNDKGNFIKETHEDQSAKASSADYLQSSQKMEMIGQNDSQSHSIDSKKAPNVAYQSQISLQMAPSWFKHYGNLKDGQALPTYNPKAATTAMPPFSGLSIGNLPENRLLMQVDSANAAQGSGTWQRSASTLIANNHLSPPSMLPSDVTNQNMAASKLKKRKIVAFDLEPWHKELNCEAPRPQNISTAEFEWAQALNRRQEEARNEAEIADDVLPVVRAKRRLIFTTHLMQQVFRPPVASILFGDASSTCHVAYSAARTALGDACNRNSKIPSDSTDVSPDKLDTSKRATPCDFSKLVECLISRAEKLEGGLSRLDQSLSVVDIKVESQELEKFSTLNCFAKFHFKAHPSTVDPASSSGPSTVQRTTPRRYVTAVPMPKILPEGRECISL
ncbi:hypothetical protein C2S53_007513 [Perilla frutescens var. hirtella]|uniref:Uncharacterized protein n=1 Tax=Perilla frutescens var. hirtella TaxID=608512 RepID=A0AAD4JAW9_PERFH|nr:hypothetical protein C2S53_007513 [Perilla frutescens var. hirtella]